MDISWISQNSGIPGPALFNSTGGAGSPLVIDNSTNLPYYFRSSDKSVQPLAGNFKVDSLSDLAALNPNFETVWLNLSGREGFFRWNSSDVHTFVSLDPDQGLYVPPQSDTTGTSGAWVRVTADERYLAKWFGVKTDYTGNPLTATDCGPIINRMYILLKALGVNVGAVAAPSIILPIGKMYSSVAILPQQGPQLEGVSRWNKPYSYIQFATGVHGIYVQATDASGVGANAQGCVIRGVGLIGGFNGSQVSPNEAPWHGINAETSFILENFFISGFQGNGIQLIASSAPTNNFSQQGNAFVIRNGQVQSCTTNIYIQGADSNAGYICKVSSLFARRWCVYDTSFLGNTYNALHADGGGGSVVKWGSYGTPACNYNGHRYVVVDGQEANASVNAPSGTTADTAYWYYWDDGSSGNAPAWTSGMALRSGGPYYGAPGTVFTGCYSELGQPFSQGTGAIFIGGCQSAGIRGFTPYLQQYQGQLQIGNQPNAGVGGAPRGIIVTGSCTFWQTGSVDSIKFWNGTSQFAIDATSTATFEWRISGTLKNSMFFNSAAGGMFYKTIGNDSHWFLCNSANAAQISVNGLKVVVGKIGYGTGAGSSVVQATNKSTGVTINAACGQITLNNASLAAGALVSFTVTNSQVAATDTIDLNLQSGNATIGSYQFWIERVTGGSFVICLLNRSSGALGEALVFNFGVLSGTNS